MYKNPSVSRGLYGKQRIETGFRIKFENMAGDFFTKRDSYPDMNLLSSIVGAASQEATTRNDEETATTETETNLDFGANFQTILNHVDTPIFIVDADGDLVLWNRALEALTQESEEGAKALTREHGVTGPAFYPDGRRSKTLADKVVDAPERTHEQYDVPRITDVDYTLYGDESVMTDATGNERHIEFTAAPLYDEHGAFVGVVEMIQDRTEDALKQQELEELVDELQSTMGAIENGNLEARAAPGDVEHIDAELVEVTESLNMMATKLEGMITEVIDIADAVSATSEDLSSTSEEVTSSIKEIEASSGEIVDGADHLAEQVEEADTSISNLSASIQEITATTNEVNEQSEQAAELAADGVSEATDAIEQIQNAVEAANEIEGDIETLERQMDEIGEITDLISDITDETNLLALNANIEAARSADGSDGFGVVANEIKSLAEESQDATEEIEKIIEETQEQTSDVTEQIDAATAEITGGANAVEELVTVFEEIDAAVSDASNGVAEIAEAVESQADEADQVSHVVKETSTMAQQIAGSIQQISAGVEQQSTAMSETTEMAQELSDSSYQLHEQVARFDTEQDRTAPTS